VIEVAANSVASERLIRRWLIVFLLFGLIWRLVRFALAFPIWGDEAMLGLNVVDRSYAELLQPLRYGQVAPVGFLWAVRFTFDQFGISDYTTRIPALIAGLGALLLFWHWAKLVVSRPAAMLATALVAVSVYPVRHGVELKPYAMDLLAVVTLLFFATRYFCSQRPVWMAALITVTPVCSFISYPQIFVAGGIALALVLNIGRADWLRRIFSLAYLLVVTGSFLAVLSLSARGQYAAAGGGMVEYWHNGFPPGNSLKFVLWFVRIHTGNMFAYPIGGKNGASMVTVLLFGRGLWQMWKKWATPVRVMLFAPFLLTFLAAVGRLYPYGESARISQHLAPAIMLTAGAGMAAFIDAAGTREAWRARLNVIGILLLGIAVICLLGNVLWPYKTKADQEMRSAIRRLLDTAGSDPIILTQLPNEGPPTLLWYLRGAPQGVTCRLDPSPESLHGRTSAWVVTCAASQVSIASRLAGAAQMKATVWSSHDLQVGPKEDGPLHLEIFHFTR
jgi:hypothetical protein